jgi:ribonuclease R
VPASLKALKTVLPELERLMAVGRGLQEQRLAAGSVDLDLPFPPLDVLGDLRTPEPDEHHRGWMIALPPTQPLALLREVVLLAGRALGHHLQALQLPALYAVQAAPDPAEINEVAKAALALDVPLDLDDEGNAPAPGVLATIFAASERRRGLQHQLSEVLRPVQISLEPGPNLLAGEAQAYAPWCLATSSYADLWNQQVLVLLLTEGKDRPSVRHKTRVDLASDACHGQIDWPLLPPSQMAELQQSRSVSLLQRLNGRARFVADLQGDLLAMAQARAAEPLVGETLTGVISGVQSYGFFVEIPPSLVEGLVHVSSLKDDWYEYRSRQNRLVGRKNRRTYMLGDAVEVTILKVDALRHQIDLAAILPDDDGSGNEPGGAGHFSSDAGAEGGADPDGQDGNETETDTEA